MTHHFRQETQRRKSKHDADWKKKTTEKISEKAARVSEARKSVAFSQRSSVTKSQRSSVASVDNRFDDDDNDDSDGNTVAAQQHHNDNNNTFLGLRLIVFKRLLFSG